MDRFFKVTLVLLFIAGFMAHLCEAQEATETQASDKEAYRMAIGNKVVRGTRNIALGWTEIPKKVVDITKETKNPLWGILAGTFQGTLKAVARTASGISDVVTAPIRADQEPFIKPDIAVE